MSANNTALREEITAIGTQLSQAKENGRVLNEAETELYVVNPLLKVLGYTNLAAIAKQSHNKIAKTYPDYTLLPNTPHEWFLEVKRLDLPLQDGEAAQAVSYASNQGASWAVLTNGRAWYFYLAHLKKPLNEKRVFQIDDLFAVTNDAAADRLGLLSLSSMTSGGLDKAWADKQLHALLRRELWTPQSSTRKSLRRLAAQETGSTVSDTVIGQVLQTLFAAANAPQDDVPQNEAPLPMPAAATASNAPPVLPSNTPAATPSLPPGDWKTLDELRRDATLTTHRKPVRVLLGGVEVQAVKSWSEVAQRIVQFLGETYGLPPLPFAFKDKSKKYLLNTEPIRADGKKMFSTASATVSGQTVFVDTHESAASMANLLFILLSAVNVSLDAVRVEISP